MTAGHRTYGDAVPHSLGFGQVPTLATRSLWRSQAAMTRISCGPAQLGMSPRIPPEDTFIVALYLTDLPHHELWSRRRRILSQGYARNSMRIVNLVDEYAARITAPHETVCFYVPRNTFDEFVDEPGGRSIGNLSCEAGVVDPVIAHLAASVLPAFERPNEASPLFVDHVVAALCAHLAHRYGSVAPRIARKGLSVALERRAKEVLAGSFADTVLLDAVAGECGLSRGHFIRAFRLATGQTPHKWLQRYRLEKAKELLLDSATSIAQIAVMCGFADQSHLTRVFTQLVGTSPALWRRAQLARPSIDERT